MNRVSTWARVSTFLRLFLIQATFNYRTMIGSGVAFCLAPILRRLYPDDQEGFDAALGRHVGLFNAHPYLAGMAVGAVARMEVEGAETEAVERFKTAVRGPLGSLGDQLVWAAWLPAVALLCAGFGLVLVRPGLAVVVFLVVYNVGHIALRAWALAAGLRSGPLVAAQIHKANLPKWTARASGLLALGTGLMLGGLALMAGAGSGGPAVWWGAGAVLAFALGARGGARSWNVAVAGFVTVVLGLAAAGAVS